MGRPLPQAQRVTVQGPRRLPTREGRVRVLRVLQFQFEVNKSFLNYPNHPITVPKRLYPAMAAEGIGPGSLSVEAPDGSVLSGDLYHGTAGYGPYYQIRIAVPPSHPILGLRMGSDVSVVLERSNGQNWVRLRALG